MQVRIEKGLARMFLFAEEYCFHRRTDRAAYESSIIFFRWGMERKNKKAGCVGKPCGYLLL